MILKTDAIALSTAPFSNSSQWVTWMTRDYGKINTLIKGAQRPKSNFLGQYDLFYTCELLFYSRSDRPVKLARECTPLQTRTGFRTKWKAMAAASYFSYLAERCTPPDSGSHNLYDFLCSTLDLLETEEISEPLITALELELLQHLGLQPQFTRCRTCGKTVQQQHVLFSIPQGSVFCNACQSSCVSPHIPLSADVLASLQAWQGNAGRRLARSTRSSIKQRATINRLMESFLQYHLDDSMTARSAALSIVKAA